MVQQKRRAALEFALALAGAIVGLFFVVWFNNRFLSAIPQPYRAVLAVFTQWIPALAALLLALVSRSHPADFGFSREHLPSQVLIGAAIAGGMSLLLTVLPIFCGLREYIGSASGYTSPFQFLYEFVYRIVGVAFAEEFVFRGFLFSRLLRLGRSRRFAVALTSVLFGLFHLLAGSLLQVVITGLFGLLWCLCREKIRHCTTLSLIIAHGAYDALLVLWCTLL
ncbi:MAG: CPBP family intramembrane metalloprotease [Oscillospiraceae bacterium]|nr:CPBP family intramembrane metalloprotease [Oscillospiraceae bacterium]